MLALKLVLVPAFLLMVSLAARRWGPSVAGWLAGLPVVTGPILFFIAIDYGTDFASRAAAAALSAVLASQCCSLAYAHAARRWRWPGALFAGLSAWAGSAAMLTALGLPLSGALLLALATLLIVPRLFPGVSIQPVLSAPPRFDLPARMLAGAILTLIVTWIAASAGHRLSGVLSVFPLLGSILAVFSHRAHGADYAATVLRGLAVGMYAFVAFCTVLSLALPPFGVAVGFGFAVASALGVQLLTRLLMRRARSPGQAVSAR